MDQLFLEACAKGNLDKAKGIVGKGFQPATLLDVEIWQLLEDILRRNDLAFIKYLFPSLLDPNLTVECERDLIIFHLGGVKANPACVAVFLGSERDLSILQYLMECGASVDSTIIYYVGEDTNPKYNLIDYACYLNCSNTFRYLTTKGAKVQNLSDSLESSCQKMNFEIIRYIIENNLDFPQRDVFPLQWTLTSFKYNRIPTFANDVNFIQNAKGISPALGNWSIFRRLNEEENKLQFEIVKYLLEKGADPNSVLSDDRWGSLTAGHCVSRGRKIELYEMLLQHGLDINKTDCDGRTPLYYAIMGNDISVMKFILENGGSIGDAESQGKLLQALTVTDINKHSFVRHGQASSFSSLHEYNTCKIEVIQFLCSCGVNLNYRDPAGHTLLDRMLGVMSFYGTMCWLVKQDIIINKHNESEIVENLALPRLSRLPNKHYVFTDVLLMAGVQFQKFVITHFENAIMMNNIEEYEALMHSNHHALFNLNLPKLIEKLNHLLEYEKRARRSYKEPDMENLIKLRRDKSGGCSKLSVYQIAKRDIQNTGTLKQLATSLIRGHLLGCGHINSLYHVIQTLSIPKALRDILSLESIVDFETKLE